MTTPILPLPDSSTQHVDDNGKPKKDFTNWLTSIQSLLSNPTKLKSFLGLATVATTGAVADLTDTVWTTYTPTVTAGAGTFGSTTSAGRYKQIGKTVFVQFFVNIITVGSAANQVNVSLPFSCPSNCVLSGRENTLTGFMLQGIIFGGTTTIFTYANGSPIGAGAQIIMSGSYEAV